MVYLAGIICGEPGAPAPAAGLTVTSWGWDLSQTLGGSWNSRGPASMTGQGDTKGRLLKAENGKQGQ